jgi:hypothetical protein
MENTVVINDYAKMDRMLREERNYILQTVKKIRTSGCNVLLIQKSILRDAVTDLSLHYLVRPPLLLGPLLVTSLARQSLHSMLQLHAQRCALELLLQWWFGCHVQTSLNICDRMQRLSGVTLPALYSFTVYVSEEAA